MYVTVSHALRNTDENQPNDAARKREQRIRRNEPKHKRARKNCTVSRPAIGTKGVDPGSRAKCRFSFPGGTL
jgi:hypothetical protein